MTCIPPLHSCIYLVHLRQGPTISRVDCNSKNANHWQKSFDRLQSIITSIRQEVQLQEQGGGSSLCVARPKKLVLFLLYCRRWDG